MKKQIIFLFVLFLFTSCASSKKLTEGAPVKQGIESSEQRNGSSFAQAIIIKEKTERTGVDAEYDWLRKNYPGYKMKMQALLSEKGKFYDRLDITTAAGEAKSIYFDISNFYGKF
jgi:hypothetical protein